MNFQLLGSAQSRQGLRVLGSGGQFGFADQTIPLPEMLGHKDLVGALARTQVFAPVVGANCR